MVSHEKVSEGVSIPARWRSSVEYIEKALLLDALSLLQ